jgi:Rho termination factor-like protein
MTKAELEKKSLADLHALAAEAGVERYRMLSRAELVAKLDDGESGGDAAESPARERAESGERAEGERPRRRRSRGGRNRRPAAERDGDGDRDSGREQGREQRDSGRERDRDERDSSREPRRERRGDREAEAAEPEQTSTPEPATAPEPPAASAPPAAESARPRRRRRRRFGRRSKGELTLAGLLLPPAGRQALLTADSREGCTALLRGLASDLSADSKGPDPVALLVDPSPEELADWRRDAPQAEIVAAGQPRHASDALAQAQSRANGGEEVILLVDSLTRLAEAYGEADAAKEFFDAAGGNLTVVAALQRS